MLNLNRIKYKGIRILIYEKKNVHIFFININIRRKNEIYKK